MKPISNPPPLSRYVMGVCRPLMDVFDKPVILAVNGEVRYRNPAATEDVGLMAQWVDGTLAGRLAGALRSTQERPATVEIDGDLIAHTIDNVAGERHEIVAIFFPKVSEGLQVDQRSQIARVHERLTEALRSVEELAERDGSEPLHGLGLTAREREILQFVLEGFRVPTLARELHISPHTVRSHLKSIFRKTGARSQAELIEIVRRTS